MIYDVIIFGGGIAGLTLAHELIKTNRTILIIEKDDDFGGMARSRIEQNSIPSEHSWRGYAPFYKNTFQIMKEIPTDNTSNVFDNLTVPIDFYLLQDNIGTYKPGLSIPDYIVISYFIVNYLLAEARRADYYSYKLEPILAKLLSDDGYNYFINFVMGPGFGMNKNELSMGHFVHFLTIMYVHQQRHTHTHSSNQQNYEHNSQDKWHVMNGPTSDVWIEPWIKGLKRKGVSFMNQTELTKLNYENNIITSAEVRKQGSEHVILAKDYVLAINPYNSSHILENSKMNKLAKEFDLLTDKTKSKHISFRIGFDKEINYPIDNIAFVMTDSEFNITWYPQEKHWKNKPNIKSLWSGTIIDFEKAGSLFNKSAEFLTKGELKEEIKLQILRSESFQELIYENNKFYITERDIDFIEIWYEWVNINDKQESKSEKWVNNIYNEPYRPEQATEYINLFLSGAHTKTTINIWSMEGAVESGKITSNLILDKYNEENIEYYQHLDPLVLRILQKLDNILYIFKLPPLFIVIIILLIYILYKITDAYGVADVRKLYKKLI